MALSKSEILGIKDVKTKTVTVPEWDNAEVFIKQLTRGQQDEYMNRQFGKFGIKQQGKRQSVESDMSLFGHDSWLVAQGMCDEDGKRMFTDEEIPALDAKNGEAIGFIAKEILAFSGMDKDIKELQEAKN